MLSVLAVEHKHSQTDSTLSSTNIDGSIFGLLIVEVIIKVLVTVNALIYMSIFSPMGAFICQH